MKRSVPISANGCLKILKSDPNALKPPVPKTPFRYRRFLSSWLPLLLYCGALLIESSTPNSGHPMLFRHEDKLLHTAAFFVMACIFARAVKASAPGLSSGALKCLTILFICLFGIGEEAYQSFIPTRTPSVGDLAADITGAVLGVWFYLDIFRGGK